jgi:uncharacterized membrane protein
MSVFKGLLVRNRYHFDDDVLFNELKSHPDFPSFKAYTDTLNHFNIPNLAVIIPKDQFSKITDPVLVSVHINGKSDIGLVEVVDKGVVKLDISENATKQIRLPLHEFMNIWDGSLIAIEANTQKQSFKPSKLTILFAVLTFLVLAQSISNGFNSSTFIYSSIAIVGILLSYLVIQISINPKTQNSKFCAMGKSTDCNSVINSVSSKFMGSLSLSDLSIIYFSAICFALLLQIDFSVLAWVSLLVLPVIPYSIYQQGIVLKKWCPLCLGIGLTLGLQFVFSFSHLSLIVENDLVLSLSLLALSFAVIALGWLQFQPIFNEKNEMVSIKQELRRFKRNYHLFMPYFQMLPQIDTAIATNDIQLGGNANAPVKILAITNPRCKHCFDVHQMLERILEKYPNQVAVDLRFLVPTQNPGDSTVLVAAGMLKAFKEHSPRFKQVMSDWYKNRDVKLWLKEVGVEKVEDQYLEILNEQRNWCTANGIGGTPITIVNNRMFPHSYDSTDLENMIEGLIEYAETNEIKVEKEKLQPI